MILYTIVSIPTFTCFSYRHTHHTYSSHSIYPSLARLRPITVRLLETLSTNRTIVQWINEASWNVISRFDNADWTRKMCWLVGKPLGYSRSIAQSLWWAGWFLTRLNHSQLSYNNLTKLKSNLTKSNRTHRYQQYSLGRLLWSLQKGVQRSVHCCDGWPRRLGRIVRYGYSSKS